MKDIKTVLYLIKLLSAWIYLRLFKRGLLKSEIWLIREKKNEARDNGYHFYCYLKEKQPQINAYYVIDMTSGDTQRIMKYGNLIEADSFEHCVYFLAAKYSISSQPFGAYPFHFSSKALCYLKKLCYQNQKVIFLQHGIICNELSKDFVYDKCNMDYFVCTADKEYNFVKKKYHYPDEAIGCIGLARFDKLHENYGENNIILIMPTWRKWLGCADKNNIPTKNEVNCFEKSDYYKAYADILTDKTIINVLQEKQYQLIFYLHYKMQGFTKSFEKYENDVVRIASKEMYDVQDLLKKSKILITDYSSVFFDFAYMNKPVIYYQFDKERFNQSHYSKGYFSYSEDGFGSCCEELSELKKYLDKLIKEDCKQPEKFKRRVDEFFCLRDEHNCERTFKAICNLKS